MKKPLPERCLRGLRDKDFVVRDENGAFLCISERAYEPNQKSRNHRVFNAGKSDHYESSINWEDQLVEAFQILSEDTRNAAFGILSIRLEDLEAAKAKNPLANKFLEWERDALAGNPFHGNLLFSGKMLPKPQFRKVAAVIASYVDGNLIFVERDNYKLELEARSLLTVEIHSQQQRLEQPMQAASSNILQADEGQQPSFLQRLWAYVCSFFKH